MDPRFHFSLPLSASHFVKAHKGGQKRIAEPLRDFRRVVRAGRLVDASPVGGQYAFMPKRPIPVSLNLSDVKSLIACKMQLDAIVSALTVANWAGARASIAALGIVDRYICDLYNRCEPYWLQYLERGAGSKTHATLKESLVTQAGVAMPAVNPDQGEKG
jgi:hypothetical protein